MTRCFVLIVGLLFGQLAQEAIGALGLETGRWLHINRNWRDVVVAKIWIYSALALAFSQLIWLFVKCDETNLKPRTNASFAGGYECVTHAFVEIS